MTREMNKPEWHNKWVHKEEEEKHSNSRELDDWIKPFFDNCCRMEKVNVGKR